MTDGEGPTGQAGGRRRPVTLADIARVAGTSPSTASRALSGRGYVSSGARQRLRDAADRLGYVPNESARTLKKRRSRVVGVVVSDLRNQFDAQLTAGIEQKLRAADYQVVVISDNSAAQEELRAAKTFLALRAPGVILAPNGRDAARLLTRQGTAVVEVDRRLADEPCDAVVLDNARGAESATRHLLELGHRRVALFAAETTASADGLVSGYCRAHRDAGVPVDERLIAVVGSGDGTDGAAAELIDGVAPTAILAGSSALTEAAWRLVRTRGLRLPRDVSLLALDDARWMAMVEPGITAIARPALEMGRRAAALLLRRFATPDADPTVELLQPALVVRESTAAPPA